MKLWDQLQSWWDACCGNYLAIYIERLPAKRLPKFRIKIDENYMLKLHGVNMSQGAEGPEIDPVYIPLFGFHREEKLIDLDLYFWDINPLRIFLFDEFPFIFIAHDKVAIKQSEGDDE